MTNGEKSDLDSILARLTPEQQAAFLKWRERIRRFAENDEILSLSGYLDTCVRLVDIMTREIDAGVKACPAHVRQAAAEQAELMRKGLLSQVEQARKEEQAAREKHLREIRQEQAALAEERAKGWDATLVNHLTTALLSVFFTALAVIMIDTKRIDEAEMRAEDRYKDSLNDLAKNLQAMAKGADFIRQVDDAGGGVHYEHPNTGALRIIVNFGSNTVAGVSSNAHEALIDLAPEGKRPTTHR
jgi:hypothetical protein